MNGQAGRCTTRSYHHQELKRRNLWKHLSKRCQPIRSGDQALHGAIARDVHHLFSMQQGIDRNVNAFGMRYSEYRNGLRNGSFEVNSHPIPAAEPARSQARSQSVHAPASFGILHPPLAMTDGLLVRTTPRPPITPLPPPQVHST